MKYLFKSGITGVVCRILLPDAASFVGGGKTNLTFASSGLIVAAIADTEATPTLYSSAGSTIETVTTLGTFAAPTATKCRFREVDAANLPGLYELQLADARWAVTNARSLIIGVQADSVPITYAEAELTGGGANNWIDANLAALVGDAVAAAVLAQSCLAVARGVVTGGTATIPVATMTPTLTDADQLKDRVLIFDRGTATAGLREQARQITASTAGGALTLATALTSAPAAGDTFGVY